MAEHRIVVGALGDDDEARATARRLRDEGHEVVFVGGHQSPEQLVRTAVAEDATRIVVDAPADAIDTITRLCVELGVADIAVGTARRDDRPVV